MAPAATKNGIKSLICLPDSAPISKVEATKGFGAEVCLVEGCYDDAHKKALELKDSEGYTFVHPFDDENVIAGQGTIALEVLNELDDIDAIVVPVGGGGLISGIAYTVKQIRPNVKVYGVQVTGAPSMYNSVKGGRIECLESVSTIADGIAVKQPGESTFALVSEYVDGIAIVSDDEVASAILALIEKQKMIAEGAGAAGSSGGNVTGVHYEKGNTESVNGCYLRIEMETRDFEHVTLIMQSLRDEGFKIV